MNAEWVEQLAGTGVVHELERRCAAYYQKEYALAISNATMGLHAIALALELRNHETITTPLTWGGTVAGFLAAGAQLAFADVDPETLALSARAVSTSVRRRTRAILAVDLHGVPADDAELRAVADAHGLWYVHDAAQSFGARIAGRPAGSNAHVLLTSLSPGKALSAGEGAVVVTDDADLHERLIWLTQHPDRQKRDLGLFHVNEFALNARIHPAAAAFAVHDFNSALSRVAARAEFAKRMLTTVREPGVATAPDYEGMGLEPSFSRVTASWANGEAVGAVTMSLASEFPGVSICQSDLVPLYAKPSWRGARTRRGTLRDAERAQMLRFELRHCEVA